MGALIDEGLAAFFVEFLIELKMQVSGIRKKRFNYAVAYVDKMILTFPTPAALSHMSKRNYSPCN